MKNLQKRKARSKNKVR